MLEKQETLPHKVYIEIKKLTWDPALAQTQKSRYTNQHGQLSWPSQLHIFRHWIRHCVVVAAVRILLSTSRVNGMSASMVCWNTAVGDNRFIYWLDPKYGMRRHWLWRGSMDTTWKFFAVSTVQFQFWQHREKSLSHGLKLASLWSLKYRAVQRRSWEVDVNSAWWSTWKRMK